MIDRYGREIDYLRVSVTDRCNLRCVYCMPASGITPLPHVEIITYEEVTRICRAGAALGVKKIKLTGGEPLARAGLAGLVQKLHGIDGIEQVTMTSNGVLLYDALPALAAAGLDAVNISLDTLDPTQYERIARRSGLETALRSIDRALALGLKVKVNCVPLRELSINPLPLARLAQNRAVDVRFIELMPIGEGRTFTPVPGGELLQQLERAFGPAEHCPQRRGNGPAYYVGFPGFSGKIGFIRAVSTGFCGTCNRVRLTSTGFLKLCLHYDRGVDLRALLRGGISDEGLVAVLHEAILQKPEHHRFSGHPPDADAHAMSQIGG